MTLVTEVLDRAARQVGLETPDSWLSATDLEYVEIRDDFLLETVDEVLERLDLPSPIGKQTVITGDGSETYDLPTDFTRLMREEAAVYETTNIRRALIPVSQDGVWTHLKAIGSTGSDRYFRLTGYEGNWQISFYREPPSGISVTVSYMSNLWKANNAGTAGSAFTDAEDVTILPRRILETGIVKRWRERKGLDPTTAAREFEGEVARLSNDSRTRGPINVGSLRDRRWPFDIPVPDEIPTA